MNETVALKYFYIPTLIAPYYLDNILYKRLCGRGGNTHTCHAGGPSSIPGKGNVLTKKK